jgi:RNA polymerase sigma-70 factor, ECF subfamily
VTRDDQLAAEIEDLYRLRYRQFLRVATAILGDEAIAHDAVQEGFAEALRQRTSFRGEGALGAWVWRIVLNTALAARRARVARREDADVRVGPPSSNGDSGDEAGVRRWIAALPERQRLAVFLRYYADLDYRSIAAALEVDVGTVSATLSAAHQALRNSLKEVPR